MHPDLSRIIFRHYNFIKYLYYFYWVIMIRLIENISTASWLVWRTVLQVHEYNTVVPCCWRTYSDGLVPGEAQMTPTWHLICCWRRRSSGWWWSPGCWRDSRVHTQRDSKTAVILLTSTTWQTHLNSGFSWSWSWTDWLSLPAEHCVICIYKVACPFVCNPPHNCQILLKNQHL